MPILALHHGHQTPNPPAIYDVAPSLRTASGAYSAIVLDPLRAEAIRAVSSSQSLRRQSVFGVLLGELERAASYPDNWDGYGAEGPSKLAVDRGYAFLEECRTTSTLVPTTIVASAEGGIAAYFIADERVAYVEFANCGEVVLAMYGKGGSAPEVLEVDPAAVSDTLPTIAAHLG